jgi:hypothetical protein
MPRISLRFFERFYEISTAQNFEVSTLYKRPEWEIYTTSKIHPDTQSLPSGFLI